MIYSYEEALEASIAYFDGDELAGKVFVDKYALRDKDDDLLEKTPSDMHKRLAKEFARIEANYPNPLSEQEIYDAIDGFNYIVPQGSVMNGVGNFSHISSLSNCTIIDSPEDSYGGIFNTDEQLAQLGKRRSGVGFDISTLRPANTKVNNAAKSSTGAVSFMHRFSNTTREVAQCLHESTLILTKVGLVPISEVKQGDEVWTENRWVEVCDIVNNKKSTVKITTKHGHEIICSLDHVFHTVDGEKKAKDFLANDPITQIVGQEWYGTYQNLLTGTYKKSNYNNSNRLNTDIVEPSVLNEELAYLIGYSYGDGHVAKHSVNKQPCSLQLALAPDWQDIGIKLNNIAFDQCNIDVDIKYEQSNGCDALKLNSRIFINYLEQNKLLKQKSHNITFPQILLSSPSSVVFAFISGYFDADGTVIKSKKIFRFASVSAKFLRIIQQVLNAHGIVCRIHVENRHDKGWRDLYMLVVNGPKNQRLFKEFCSESIKIQSEKSNWIEKVTDWTKTLYTVKDFNTGSSRHKYIQSNFQNLSYSVVERLSNDLGIQKDCFLIHDTIKSIEHYEDNSNVYDLVLANTNLFFANGFYAHNSGRRGALLLAISVHHPDIYDFVVVKDDLTKVTGANISIQITDEFMNAVKANTSFMLKFPVDIPNIDSSDMEIDKLYTADDGMRKLVNAKNLWDKIILQAHKSGEPGLFFKDRHHWYSTSSVYPEYENICSNPCISKDLRLLTDKGYVEIGELAKQGYANIINKDGDISTGKVWCTGIKDIYGIISDSGRVLAKCTNDHVWMTSEGLSIETKDLVGHKLMPYDEPLDSAPLVDSIDYIGPEEVFDFNEPKTHWGVGNGYVLSNCGEIFTGKFDSCRLIAMNMFRFVDNPFTKESVFNINKWKKYVYIAQKLNDDLVDLELESINRILKSIRDSPEPNEIKSRELNMWKKFYKTGKEGRRTGLGFTALGDTLAALGLKYDSKEALAQVDLIMRAKLEAEFTSSIDMAEQRGQFDSFDKEIEKKSHFIQMMLKEFSSLTKRMMKVGRRNSSLSTISPCGTLSLLTGTTSGLEPMFLPFYIRRKKVTTNEIADFTDDTGIEWKNHNVIHPKLQHWLDVTCPDSSTNIDDYTEEELTELFKKSPWYKATANDIDWGKRIELQALVQKYITHSISSTINLPFDVSTEVVGDIYVKAWESGCKGITVYRDGCRDGVLISKDTEAQIPTERPTEVPCDVFHIRVRHKDDGEWISNEYFVLVGMLDGKPYEVFSGKNGSIPEEIQHGKIIKVQRHYKIKFDNNDVVNNISTLVDDTEEGITRLISLSLQNGVNIHDVVKQLEKVTGKDMQSFAKSLTRALKTYIPNGTPEKEKCPTCGVELIREEGCVMCKGCGWSKCS